MLSMIQMNFRIWEAFRKFFTEGTPISQTEFLSWAELTSSRVGASNICRALLEAASTNEAKMLTGKAMTSTSHTTLYLQGMARSLVSPNGPSLILTLATM